MAGNEIGDASKVIDDLGGTSKTARFCDVTDGAVSQWRRNGIPKAQLKFIRAARPDIFQPTPIDQVP